MLNNFRIVIGIFGPAAEMRAQTKLECNSYHFQIRLYQAFVREQRQGDFLEWLFILMIVFEFVSHSDAGGDIECLIVPISVLCLNNHCIYLSSLLLFISLHADTHSVTILRARTARKMIKVCRAGNNNNSRVRNIKKGTKIQKSNKSRSSRACGKHYWLEDPLTVQ